MTSSVPSRRGRAARPDALVGTLVAGKYQILSLVAKGGMGKIYRAEQQPLGRIVALKLLHVAKAPGAGDDTHDSDAEVSEKRFFREASILAKLQHPNIVTVYDFGSIEAEHTSAGPPTVRDGAKGPFLDDDDAPDHRRFFMAMEFLVGETLHDRLHARRVLPPDETVRFVRQVARGLREAHALGIVHRDLKPLNLMIVTDRDGEEQIKILDFGIVKVVEGLAAPAQELTEEGLFVGSPMYMAPEQIETGKVDARSDVYSLGVVIYRCLCGQTPFPQGSTMQIMMAHLSEPPVPLHERAPDTPGWLAQLVHRCLEKDPKKRPQSMDELLRALNEHSGASSGNITLPNQQHRPSFSGASVGPILPPVDEHTVASGSSPTLTRSTALAAPRMPSSTSPERRDRKTGILIAAGLALVALGVGGTLLLWSRTSDPSRTTSTPVSGANGTTSALTTASIPPSASAAPTAVDSGDEPAGTDAATSASAPPTSKPTNKPFKPTPSTSTKPPAVPTLDIQLKR